MHAARAIHKQRERREEKLKLEIRRSSAASQTSRFPRSPAVSIDTTTRRHHSHNDNTERLNFSYVGFIIAAFGAVPLLVGTFVEVPALWEVGLGVTLVGIFIGLVFWCTELCAEAKKISLKKKQLSSRGKIEDSNLLQVPDRKFHQANGLANDSRRGSFPTDSVSLISPAAPFQPNRHLPHSLVKAEDSISQYSSSDASKSTESTTTLHAGIRANGHAQPAGHRGPRKDGDNRVVSLVQQEPGLEDESDSDAETVIEAPTGGNNTRIIQVQSCQEKTQRPSLFKGDSLNSVDSSKPIANINKPPLATSFSLENETIAPLVPHHRTIRMPVLPQEVDKLKRCECGRFLLDSDKLLSLQKQYHHHGSSMPATAYNSPAWSAAGTTNPSRKVFAGGLPASSNNSSGNDLSLSENFQGMTAIPENTKIIKVSQLASSQAPSGNNSGNRSSSAKNSSRLSKTSGLGETPGESVVQVEPTVSHSTAEFLSKKTEPKISNTSAIMVPSADQVEGEDTSNLELDQDKELAALLELTANQDATEEESKSEKDQKEQEVVKLDDGGLQSASRPTSLSLGVTPASTTVSDSTLPVMSPMSSSSESTVVSTGNEISSGTKDREQEEVVRELLSQDFEENKSNPEMLTTSTSMQKIDQEPRSKATISDSALQNKDMSLDEILDTLEQEEQKQEGEPVAVVVQ